MKPLSVSFSATSSVYSRIGYETVLNKRDHSTYLFNFVSSCVLVCAVHVCIGADKQ